VSAAYWDWKYGSTIPAVNATQVGGTAQTGADVGGIVANIHDTDLPAVKSDTAAILVDTGTTLDGRIPAALVGGRMDASVGAQAVNADSAGVTEILTRVADAPAGSAPTLALTVGTILTSGGNNTASLFYTDLPGGNDFWKDCLILITSGALAGQLKKVGAFADANGVVTLTAGQAFTATPADGVTFTVENR
jgi:hypothetical protein